jgi:D-alanyl-D-alanine carboxypeptidase
MHCMPCGLFKVARTRVNTPILLQLYWIALLILLFLASGCGGGSDGDSLPRARLQAIVKEAVAESPVPGAILGVRSSSDVWIGADGESDTAVGALMTPDMQVRLASITKPFTAVLVMSLVQDGILSLDDTVEMHLPGLVPGGNAMSLRMLLNHSAGVADHTESTQFWREVYAQPTRQWRSQEIVSLSAPRTPTFPPGTAYSYSNTGYYLLGLVMEAATGKDVSSLFQERIAGPARLARTTLTRPGTFEGPLENGYAWMFTTRSVEATRDWNFSWDWTAGAGVSTAADMLRFADRLFQGRILRPESVATMMSSESLAPGAPYGLGLGVLAADDPLNPFGETLIGHTGDNPGTATQWQHLPDQDVTIFAAVNRNDISEGPAHEPPVAGGAVALDMLAKAIDAVLSSDCN